MTIVNRVRKGLGIYCSTTQKSNETNMENEVETESAHQEWHAIYT